MKAIKYLVLGCVLLFSHNALANDELCVINNSSQAIKYTFDNLGELDNQKSVIAVGAKAGDQNKCVTVTASAVGECVQLSIEVDYNGQPTWFGVGDNKSELDGDIVAGDAKQIVAKKWADVTGHWDPCFRNPAVGKGAFYQYGPREDSGVSDVPWPAGILMCNRSVCQYHTGEYNGGLYRLFIIDRPAPPAAACSALSPNWNGTTCEGNAAPLPTNQPQPQPKSQPPAQGGDECFPECEAGGGF